MEEPTEENLFERIGGFIKMTRTKKGLTQHQVAEQIGNDAQFISKIEQGKKMSIPTLEKLMKALNFDIEFIEKD